jgi:hypothetical protein
LLVDALRYRTKQELPPSPSGTGIQEEKACTRDVPRFCRKLMDQGDFTILACLKENRAKLSLACRYVLVSHGQ